MPHIETEPPSGPRAPWREGRAAAARRRRRHGAEAALHLRLLRLCDVAIVLVVLLVPVFIGTNLGNMSQSFSEFLALRITLKNLLLLSLFTVAWRMLCKLTGLYEWPVIGHNRRAEFRRVVLTCGMASAVALVFPAISVTGAFRYTAVPYFWVGSVAAMLALRSLLRALFVVAQTGRRTALIVGSGPRAQSLYRELRSPEWQQYEVMGFVDSDHGHATNGQDGPVLGSLEQLEGILMRNPVDEVLVALPIKSCYVEIQTVLQSCEEVGVPARFCVGLFDRGNGQAHLPDDWPALVARPRSPEGWTLISKRVIDLIGGTVGLVLLAPVLLVAMAAIRMTSRGPAIFSQERCGLNRRRFRMYKLRTMVHDAAELQGQLEDLNEATGPVFKIRDDPRVTRVGRVLRRFSIDELPQLVNVLRGDMSLVGPRPLPIRDVDRITGAALMRRFSVRPGLTCLWQISGRSDLGFDEWVRLDLKYIDEWTFALDLLILLRTVPAVLAGRGAA